MGGLNPTVLQQFQDQLEASPTAPASSIRAYRSRLASLRQLLFEVGVLEQPPRRRPWARTLEQRFNDVAMAEPLRATLLRYVHTRAAVLRPKSVESLVNDLLPFAEFLTAHHREVTALRHLQRAHIEAFLTWNRTRTWRGRTARARTIGPAVAQSTVLSVRNMLEDLAAWDWADAPAKRLVFASDVPKLDRALPRALAPDVDAALMSAVAGLHDPFARVGLQVLRGTGLRVGELLDLELHAVIDYGPAGPGYGSRWASSPPNAPCPWTPPPWPPSTNGPAAAACTARSRTPAPASPPTSCSPSTADDSAPPGCATGCSPQPPLPTSEPSEGTR